ncbi:LysR family transcriptional regulator [Aliiglaciecola sp. 3_MG-2023]|uniref:LysR family transcriptional regulator n=1 Tax=unclassified Aliiglaciecola TaxID=2593648 RepID=UPI0026E4529C|nr:LysR family transcriptional regulator [Aliiglaciecola sp. 3_MG-2023]MDO6695296.1 LysR family transcriptional regulator [Aliiglaciecola sp. 3_MG-2023]
MNLDHLKLFVRIAALNNISAAGNELHLSPAVSSNYISKLEESLGTRLIHRTTRKVSLTEEGRTFLPHAENVLMSVESAMASVGIGKVTPQGRLRITAPASFGRMHLVPALAGFLKHYPDIDIDLRLSDSIVDLVEGGFDIAIRDASLKDSSLIAKKLATDKRIVCASPDYIAEYGAPATPDDLQAHSCITLVGLDNWHFQTDGTTQTIKVISRFTTDNGEATRDASVNGLGITVASTWSVYQHLKEKTLVPVLSNYPLLSETDIWAVFPSSRLLAPKVRVFIDYFTAYFGDIPYWDL